MTDADKLWAIHDLASARLRPPNADGLDVHALSDLREIERISRPAGLVDAGVHVEPSEAAKARPREAVTSGAPPPVDRDAVTTLHGTPVEEIREQHAAQSTGMHADYIVLTDAERAKGFVRPVRRTYKHVGAPGPKSRLRDLTIEEHEQYDRFGYVKYEAYPPNDPSGMTGMYWTQARLDAVGKGCGTTTTMGQKLAETYAREPTFYGSTFCCACNKHPPVGAHGEFVWDGTTERVGT